ncbi:MAG: hypothetical protein HPZ79_00940 [Oscillospiraceae bacterium]|nr:hypothetical protein [Oscillospiraceae bacterium]
MKLRYELNMSIEAAEDRMSQHMDSEHSLLSVLAKSRLIPFYSKVGMFGGIQAHRLWLAYIHGAHNYPRRCFFAQFIEMDGITVLQGRFRFSFYSIAAKVLAYCVMILIAGASSGNWSFWIPTGLIMGNIYIILSLLWSLVPSKPLERKMEDFLLEIYAAELMPKNTEEPDDHQQMSEK